MKCRLSNCRDLKAIGRLSLGLWLVGLSLPAAVAQVKRETLPDGVEHFYRTDATKSESYLTKRVKEIFNVAIPSTSAPPFGRSVAFLAGVAVYRHLSPQLPSVHRDLDDMRDFLLSRAGFDEVYVAVDDVVNRDLVESYIKEVIPLKMDRNDRLLFYYSGHGGDNQGKTGYMLFGGVQKGQFWSPQVLAVDVLGDWSRELPIQHILFILDSCASGLGIAPKSSPHDSDKLLMQTLSSNGSRVILTAGTADEATYAQEGRLTAGNGVFTKALLDAFESRSSDDEGRGFITITDLFADIEKRMGEFRIRHGKATTPRMWTLQETEYRGTFVFLNLSSTSAQLSAKQAKAMGVTFLPKKGAPTPEDLGPGIIQVYSEDPGELYIDDRDMGYMMSRQPRQFFQEAMGEHHLWVSAGGGNGTPVRIMVESGRITYANFGLKSPINESGDVPVGTLVIASEHFLRGEVFIDDFHVGQLEKNGQLTVVNVVAGQHSFRIEDLKQAELGQTVVKPGEIQYTVMRPSPPTIVSVIVR